MHTPPPVPLPPTAPAGPHSPAPPRLPLSPTATLAHLLLDGLLAPGTRRVELYLSPQEFVLNQQVQSAQATAKYCHLFELDDPEADSTVVMTITL